MKFADAVHAVTQLGDKGLVQVTLTTTQHNGLISYATGWLSYKPGAALGPVFRFARLTTTSVEPLTYLFSDRAVPVSDGGGGLFSQHQPFAISGADKLGLSISLGPIGSYPAKFTLLSWGSGTFSVTFKPDGDLLHGIGPGIHLAEPATFLLAFVDVRRVPDPPH